ncbi:MAG: biopolymer transporter ExbD [Bacteroidales bacterium]|jgi:biopolymer transport protein ExbD|nr:biopolymer transporter ExbD [Bacteroidales bacterium]
MARKLPEIATSSMADISFLLLTFFLLTSSIDTDLGLSRRLPPLPDDIPPPPVKQRNVFVVLVNAYDMLLVEGKPGNIKTLREDAKEFFLNPNNDPNLSERRKMETIEHIGPYERSKGVISLQNDRGTSYKTYIAVQNELTAAFNEMRDDLSIEKFGVKFDDLTNEDYRKAIQEAIPVAISEAEPKDIGGKD